MKTFSQFVNEAKNNFANQVKHGSPESQRERSAEKDSRQSSPRRDYNAQPFDYVPPPEHDKLHDTYEQARSSHASNNPKAHYSEHALHAYKKVEEVHGPEGLKTLIRDHKQMGPSREKDEALIKLGKGIWPIK